MQRKSGAQLRIGRLGGGKQLAGVILRQAVLEYPLRLRLRDDSVDIGNHVVLEGVAEGVDVLIGKSPVDDVEVMLLVAHQLNGFEYILKRFAAFSPEGEVNIAL